MKTAERLAKAIAGTERSIEVLKALMALLVDNASKEYGDELLDDANQTILDAVEDMHGEPFILRFPVYDMDESTRRMLTVEFCIAMETDS